MRIEDIKTGDPVIYIPKYSLIGDKSKWDNENLLGIVTSKNERYVFVRYKNTADTSQATTPEDLYSLYNRPDLMEKLGMEIKPINRVCELYIEEKQNWKNQHSIL